MLSYGFDDFRIHPSAPVSFTSGDSKRPDPLPVRPASRVSPTPNPNRIRVATFNAHNFFTTIDRGPPACGPRKNKKCRGATTETAYKVQRDKIISALDILSADLIALVEIENNDTTSLEALASGLNTATNAGSYTYINTGALGQDVIKVGFLYNRRRLTPTGGFAALDGKVDPRFNDRKNRPSLAQSFRHIQSGEVFTAVVNHLKSKGSDCDAQGDPDTGDGQGNCNLTRTRAVQALVDWVAQAPTGTDDTDVLLLGDFNAYRMEDPIRVALDAGFTDPLARFAPDATTYIYRGRAGTLDHALASPSMARQVVRTVAVPINAAEPRHLENEPGPFRASDHDPVVVDLELGPAP